MKFSIDDKTVYYGNGNGVVTKGSKPIIFLHGAGFDHTVWVLPSRYFARKGYRVIALDLPGHGRSDGPALGDVLEIANWVLRFAKELDLTDLTVVGHSMGSLVAYALAAKAPELVSKLVLLGTSSPMPVTNLLLNAARDNHHAAIEMANTWSHSSMGSLGSAQNPGVSNLNSDERLLERTQKGVYFADFQACNDYDSSKLGPVATSTLVLMGDRDKMTPAKSGIAVAELLPNSFTHLIKDCGHSMLSEKPNEVLDALSEFIIGR